MRFVWLALLVACREPQAAPRAYMNADPWAGARPAEPMSCLMRSSEARAEVEYGIWKRSVSSVVIEMKEQSALHGSLWVDPIRHRAVETVPLSREDAKLYFRDLIGVARRAEQPGGCIASHVAFARLTYWCDGRKSGPFLFISNECDPNDVGDRSGETYARAHGLTRAARHALEQHAGEVSEVKERRVEIWDEVARSLDEHLE